MTYLLLLSILVSPPPRKPFELVDGDRVLFVGNTFFERDLKYNYLEQALTERWPSRNFKFRNLGWDGDTVWGEARAEFGSTADGFDSLVRHVLDLKPTVIFVAYGLCESYAGSAGVEPFVVQFDKLLDSFSRTQARIILLSPIRHEDLGRPLPDPAGHNRNLRLFVDAIAGVAGRRGCDFVNLFELSGSPTQPLTQDGIHLNERGYRAATWAVERSLGLSDFPWEVALDSGGKAAGMGTSLSAVAGTSDGVRFTAADETLPSGPRILKVEGLNAARYRLRIDGIPEVAATSEEWARGVALAAGPEFGQAEKLRRLIAEKNVHYFHYWRPENDTYIFGFRRKEQGNLTTEFPKYPPLLDEKEAEIAKLRVPTAHAYVLERVQ